MNADDLPLENTGSVTWLVERLKEKDLRVADEIWQRYFDRLLTLARAKLRRLPSRAVDEEDVLVSVFDRFFRAASEGRFTQFQDRNDLWQLLLMLTERKVTDEYRRSLAQKRGSGQARHACNQTDVDLAQLREVADRQPSAEFVSAFNDSLEAAVQRLDDPNTRHVALLRLEGYTNPEIAQRLDISLSSVERKLRVIRELWNEESVTET